MEVKEAIDVAKRYAADLFGSEGLIDPRLEEVEFDEGNGVWAVTIGMLRPLRGGAIGNVATQMAALRGEEVPGSRIYRVVKVRDGDEHVLSIKMRDEFR